MPHARHAFLAFVTLSVLFGFSCPRDALGPAAESGDPYVLVAIDSSPLPVVIALDDGLSAVVRADTLRFDTEADRYTQRLHADLIAPGKPATGVAPSDAAVWRPLSYMLGGRARFSMSLPPILGCMRMPARTGWTRYSWSRCSRAAGPGSTVLWPPNRLGKSAGSAVRTRMAAVA